MSGMPWYAWAVLGWLAVQAGYQILMVGKPRDPRTPLEALNSVVELGLVAWAVVELAS